MLVKVDIQSLIDKIYLPPTIDQASIDKITSLAENLGYNFQFVRSKLSFDPVY